MSHLTSLWSVHKPEIDAYIKDQTEMEAEGIYRKLFNVKTSNRLNLTDVGYSGFQPMVEVGEMGDAVEDEAREGYTSVYTRRYYRKKAVFSKPLLDTDISPEGTIEDVARALPSTIEYSRNLYFTSMFRRAFDTTLTFGDGKQLISTVHPRKDGGGTQNNTFSDGVQRPLTYDNVILLEDQMLSMLSNSGNLMALGNENRNKLLFCSPYLRTQAFQIANIDKEPDTDENNANYIVKGANYDVLVSKFFSWEAATIAGETTVAKSSSSNWYDKMWGILDMDMAKMYFKAYVSEGYPDYAEKINEDNESVIKYAYDSHAHGNSGFFPVVMSKGDNTTFSS